MQREERSGSRCTDSLQTGLRLVSAVCHQKLPNIPHVVGILQRSLGLALIRYSTCTYVLFDSSAMDRIAIKMHQKQWSSNTLISNQTHKFIMGREQPVTFVLWRAAPPSAARCGTLIGSACRRGRCLKSTLCEDWWSSHVSQQLIQLHLLKLFGRPRTTFEIHASIFVLL